MTNEIGGLLGGGPTVACKVIDDLVSVHWWAADAKPDGSCLCGARSKRETEPTDPEAACCDFHNEHCEPPGDLCCQECTESAE